MTEPDPYKAKLFKLMALRLAGVGLALVGLVWASSDKLGPPSPIGGAVLIIVGLLGSLLLARRLRLRWLKDLE